MKEKKERYYADVENYQRFIRFVYCKLGTVANIWKNVVLFITGLGIAKADIFQDFYDTCGMHR